MHPCFLSLSAFYNYTCNTYTYSKAQLQGNVCTHFRRILHTFRIYPVWQKRGVALTYVLLQLYREVLHLHGSVSRASQTHLARVSEAFGHYLVAELYCTPSKERIITIILS